MRRWGILAALALITGCTIVPQGGGPRPSGPAAPPAGVTSAALAGVAAGPNVGSLGLRAADADMALASFRESCRWLLTRPDASGLTRPDDWRPACGAVSTWAPGRGHEFFQQYFETARVGDGAAFATGYFEPEIRGSRTRIPGYDVPVYAMPPDLVRAWPEDVPASERTGRPPLGRYDESGKFTLYYDRAQIEAGALAGRGLEIAWVADPVEFFFLQIQGSGRLVAPDGSVMRIGYAGQNGREYVGVGRVMRERGLIGDGPGQYSGSMQGIMAYIHKHPEEGRDLMRLNKSWIFFQELKGDGPLGSLGVPVRRESSVAVDPAFVPYGAPVWLQVDRPEAGGLWVAQDTGGAIKGANRFDTFWGAGEDARRIAGGMSARGQALVLLPKGTVARLHGR
ncbi:murein transglycosylase A [Pelagerythrobacter aerophilus]|uniref:peptidoglycan lytic exotransglycosylase n=1 Tax=Pelagerythrobacter aerophilus TaxID=2306995 RepID=A0A418NER3_9SPHN|nr:murein transglycosylase A [Pelagerythrobacter aerophilus]RIV75710.1 hypothetical protein D2V04_15640 [Pelagerythrobacter aerophilus]